MVALSRFVLALWVPAHFGSAIQLRPDKTENCPDSTPHKLCIDFGSSGAKFSICGEDAKEVKFPKNGPGAFAATAEMDDADLKTKLGDYLLEQFSTSQPMNSATTCVQVCGGTAGNRFVHLAGEDPASWTKFNTALRHFATIPTGGDCRTFSGTEEANFEWTFTKYSPVFIGIGGASMQLHLPSAERDACPDLTGAFNGGVGARNTSEFCEITKSPKPDGVLWSLLADQKFNLATDAAKKKMHIFGGMNEVAERYYHILGTEKLLAEASIEKKELDWVHEVISKTALADPMWVAVLKSFHGEGCTELPLSKDMVFLANPSLGQKHLNHPLLDKVGSFVKGALQELITRKELQTPKAGLKNVRSSRVRMRSLFRPQRRRTEADVLHHAIRQMSAYHEFEPVAKDVASACLEAVKEAVTNNLQDKARKKYFTEYDSKEPKKLGFLCTVKLFSLSWMSTLAGHTKATLAGPTKATEECFEDNFQKLLGARHMHGDWMSGALALQAK